ALCLSSSFFFSPYGHRRALSSFPTRRSSDLDGFEDFGGLDAANFDNQGIGHLVAQRNSRRSSTSVSAPCAWPKSMTSWSCAERRSEEHTSELQSRENLVCRLLLEKKKATAN